MEIIIASVGAAVFGAIGPTLTALAAYRHAKQAAEQTNGMLHEPLERIESKLDDLAEWQAQHVTRWHLN